MIQTYYRILLITIVAVYAMSTQAWSQPRLLNLGTLGYQNPDTNASYGIAISSDGSTVVGQSTSPQGLHAFRWRNGLMEDIGTLNGSRPPSFSDGCAVNADGSVVGGQATTRFPLGALHAFRWTENGIQDLGAAADPSIVLGMSSDGSVLVGKSRHVNESPQAVSWTNNIMKNLGGLGSTGYSAAYGVNANGTTITGSSWTTVVGTPSIHAFKWNDDLMQDLGTLGGAESNGYAISGDGLTIVGGANRLDSYYHAFLWNNSLMEDLGALAANSNSVATAISSDGTIVGGSSGTIVNGVRVEHAFLYNKTRGMVDMNLYLPTLGIDLDEWVLVHTRGISADGSSVTGIGLYQDEYRAFLITNLPFRTCPANFDGVGGITVVDLFKFLNAWFLGMPSANVNVMGGITITDIFFFLSHWFAGC